MNQAVIEPSVIRAAAAGESERPERTVPVYPDGSTEPICWVSTTERDAMVESGAATRFGRRGCCLRLRRRDGASNMSATMGAGAIVAHAAGDPLARIASIGWRAR